VIATATNTVVATVPVGGLPLGIAIKPGGAFAYVANRAGTVSVINTATNTVVATVPVGPPTGVAITPTPLVGWWPAEGNANDVQGGNNGTLQGGMTFSTGEIGQAFSFNGIDADVKVSASAATDVGTSGGFTVGAWIAPTDTSFLRPLVEWNNNANGIGAHLWLEPGGVIFTNIFDTGGAEHVVRSPSGSVCAGVFQHVALTYDKASGVATIYANAAIVAQQAVGQFTPQTSYDLYFGVRPSSPFGDAGIRFSGSMDEVQLFNLALTQAEVQAIVDAGSPRICQAITVTAPAPASAAFNTSFGVAATSSSGLAVAITTTGGCSGSGSGSATITMLSGTTACEVHYNQAGDSDYSAAPEVTSSTTAQKASQTITVTQGAPATGGTRRSSRWRRQRQEARWH
jgi:YVTN family beta-propeller protein